MAANTVQLTSGIRSNLLLLQNTTAVLEKTQVRLSTGNKINSAIDGPAQFFAAKGLNQRASDLGSLKDGIGQAINTIKAADTGMTSVESLTEQARGLTTQALGSLGNDSNSVALRRGLANQYNAIMRQIDKLAGDSGYQGKNLLVGSGLQVDATSSSKTDVNALTGVSGARTTNVVDADAYVLSITGDGAITGSTNDTVQAERSRGINNLEITGFADTTKFNFDSISIKLAGGKGKDKTFTLTEGSETYTATFTTAQWDTANADGKTLHLSYAFASGTKVSFDVSFKDIEDVPDTAGVGTSVIEKNVNLQVVAKNSDGVVVSRDGLNALGQAKVVNGENAFAFDSGTARIIIDERQILQSSKYTAAVSKSYGTGAGAITTITPNSTSTISFDEKIIATATGASYNYTLNNFGSFTVALKGGAGASVTVAAISAGSTTAAFTGVGLNASANYSITFNLNELKYVATAAAAAAGEVSVNTTIGAGVLTASAGTAISVSTVGSSFVDNTVTNVTISVNAVSTGGATFQYTDQFGGTASQTVTLSGFSIAAGTSVNFTIAGGANSGATYALAISANVLFGATGGTITSKVRGEFTGENTLAFDVRGANTGSTATLKTKQLVDGNEANNLEVQFNETNTSGVTVISQNVQTDGQGLRLDQAQNYWLDRTDIDNSIKQLDAAKLRLRAAASALSTNLNIIQTRETYTKEFSNVLTEGAIKLVGADQNEEGANILTLQTRQQLGTISLSLANQAQQAILRLF